MISRIELAGGTDDAKALYQKRMISIMKGNRDATLLQGIMTRRARADLDKYCSERRSCIREDFWMDFAPVLALLL